MLDTNTKQKIDSLREILLGKVSDPKSQVEQITIALFYKFMWDMDNVVVELGGKPTHFSDDYAKYSWDKLFDPSFGGEEVLALYKEAVEKMENNPHIPGAFRDIFRRAYLPYNDSSTLRMFLKLVNDGFHYSHSEMLGDAFEYLLSILGTQGAAGQFRTPRHIIDFITECVNPQKDDVICDPACGTAGFVISAYNHILKQNTDKKVGDKLSPSDRKKLGNNLIGLDIDPMMVKLALANMYLHGFQDPNIYEYDSLTNEDRWNDTYDVVLANPPFMTPKNQGGIRPHKRFTNKSNKAEVLFVDLIATHLSANGKAGVVVPNGIVASSQSTYKNIRKLSLENGLICVMSLPQGVFNPYSAVKTSILLFNKHASEKTDSVLFIDIKNDGFDLGAQRELIKENDLPKSKNIYKKFLDTILNNENFIFESDDDVKLIKKQKILLHEHYSLLTSKYREQRTINSEYNVVELGEVADFKRGPFGSHIKKSECVEESENTYKLYEQGNVIKNDFNRGSYYISSDKFNKLYKFEVVPGDILITCAGTLGRIAIVPKDIKKGIFNSVLMRVRLNEDKILSKYFIQIFGSFYLQRVIEDKSTGVALKNLFGTKELKKLRIPLPPIQIQKQIISEIEGIEIEIEDYKTSIQNKQEQIQKRIAQVWGE